MHILTVLSEPDKLVQEVKEQRASEKRKEQHSVQKHDQQRDIEVMMAYLLTSGVGYGISLFSDLLQLTPLEDGTFSVREAIMFVSWSEEEREKEREDERGKILAAASGALSVFEDRHQRKAELETEVIFAIARDAVSFFERRRRERLLGYDFETNGASTQKRQDIRNQLM